jgi:hypothetical protein
LGQHVFGFFPSLFSSSVVCPDADPVVAPSVASNGNIFCMVVLLINGVLLIRDRGERYCLPPRQMSG